MNDSGYSAIFAACEEAALKLKLEESFITFRDSDVFHFVTAVGSQKHGPDREALSIAMSIDPLLCFDYMARPKSLLGYGTSGYQRWDVVDSRHIMMATTLFAILGRTLGNIVEIGGGFGNWMRLNETVIDFHRWTIIDLPFISQLQRWYLTQELADLSKLVLVDIHDYPAWLAKNEEVGLVIGAHSLSEMAWATFCDYFDHLVIRAKYFFYATHTYLPTIELVQKKIARIETSFRRVNVVTSECGTVNNILYQKRP